MARQRHWVNRGGPGDCIFATTTVLDFVHAFARPEPRTEMQDVILAECRRMRAALHAFVVMPHHIHLVATMPDDHGPTDFIKELKQKAANQIVPLLRDEELAAFSDQTGLNRHRFWQRSFRGKLILTDAMFRGAVEYVHRNPVRAGYVESPERYVWSSARLWEDGLWSAELGIEL